MKADHTVLFYLFPALTDAGGVEDQDGQHQLSLPEGAAPH